jgi:type I restriction enzyme S subunit
MITSWTSCTIQDLQNKGEAELKTGPFGTQLHASDYVETGTPVTALRAGVFTDTGKLHQQLHEH